LCLSIARPAKAATAGQPAPLTVHVWITEGLQPAGKVTVSLYTLTAGQQATFTTRDCHSAGKCTIPDPGSTPVALEAEVTAKHPADSVTVKAVGEISAPKLSEPLAVTESVRFTSSSPNPKKVRPTPLPSPTETFVAIPPGPLPTIGSVSSSSKLITPGNAAGLFPPITPSAAPTLTPTDTAHPTPIRTGADPNVQVLPMSKSIVTAQLAGILALVLAITFVALAKLLPRRRSK
jgi:hypothetical protein